MYMISSLYSVPQNVVSSSGDTRGGKFIVEEGRGGKASLECCNRSQIIRGVVRHDNANGTMLRRSAQLLLTPENEHFEVEAKIRGQTILGWKDTEIGDRKSEKVSHTLEILVVSSHLRVSRCMLPSKSSFSGVRRS